MTGVGLILMAALLAAPAPKTATTICATQVEASGNRAKGEVPKVDEKLEKAKTKLPGRYSTYKHLGEICWDLAVGDAKMLDLLRPYQLHLRREKDGETGVRVRWSLWKAAKRMTENIVEFKNHGFLWIGGPQSEKTGGDLFVLLHAHW